MRALRSRFNRALFRIRSTVAPVGSRRARALVVAAPVLLGGIAAAATLSLTPTTGGEVGPGRVELRTRLGVSRTTLRLPPLGAIWADTHNGFVAVELRVDEIDVADVQGLVSTDSPEDELRANIERDLRPLTRELARRALLFSAVAGAVAGGLTPRRRWWSPLAGAAGGTAAVVLLLGATWRSFDAEAFEAAPVFEGPLEEAPRIVDTVLEHVEGFEGVRDKYDVLSRHIADLYATELGVPAGRPADETRILHVSDIHLNPIGLEITKQLTEEFQPHAVLDTGDLTSFGQEFETVIVPMVEDVGVPYLFVPGNHDSEANRAALAGAANVTLLDGEMAQVGPVRVLGMADPTFTASGELTHEQANAILDASASRVRSLAVQQRADLLAVHNVRLAEGALGRVPYVAAGHVHRTTSDDRLGTLVLTVGSTGATGLGELTQPEDPRYEAEILRFSGSTLVAVDRLVLEGRRGDFQISREVIDRPPLQPPDSLRGGFR